jgi:hypothetical protein
MRLQIAQERTLVKVTTRQLQRFRTIWNAYGHGIQTLAPADWNQLSHDDVWIRVVIQVVVVGRAEPAQRLHDKNLCSRIAWHRISGMKDVQAAKAISSVLRTIGARYAGSEWRTCKKTKALIRNRNYLRDHPGGPRGFLRDVATLPGSSRDKVAFVAARFSYIKNKGARDFLTTGFGLVKDHIAFDTRVVSSLRHIGLTFPGTVTSHPSLYDDLERDLITQVCRPLGISGAQLDQLLFLHYKDIKTMATALWRKKGTISRGE